MKIVLHTSNLRYDQAQKIRAILSQHAPQHQFSCDGESCPRPDLHHFFSHRSTREMLMNASRSVVCVRNLNFLDFPHIYGAVDRYFRLPLFKQNCKSVGRIVVCNSLVKRGLMSKLGVRDSNIDVCMPLFSTLAMDQNMPLSPEQLIKVRKRYDLPESFILMMGAMDTHHNHYTALKALVEGELPHDIVICARHSFHTDDLLLYARKNHIINRVHCLYEYSIDDVGALYALALAVVYAPDSFYESSICPIVEGLKLASPMILSDTELNREAASAAAIYVKSGDWREMATAIRNVTEQQSLRAQLAAQCCVEADRFSEESVASSLMDIYSSIL